MDDPAPPKPQEDDVPGDLVGWMAGLAILVVLAGGVALVVGLAVRDVRRARAQGTPLSSLGGDNSTIGWGDSGSTSPGPM
ncbi:hypothetical protein [Modestobacter sp. I12A-02662]|uniref:hypothetical protein n=1 Tax=Modestobacter sp. I12A-02662 TaxID=1730496 RepID=UPI0034DF1350